MHPPIPAVLCPDLLFCVCVLQAQVKTLKRSLRTERQEAKEDGVEAELAINRLKNEHTASIRDTVSELREYQQHMQGERDEAVARAAELDAQATELSAALERVRCTSKAGLLEQVAALQGKVRELGARRKANQRTVQDCNLSIKRERTTKVQATKEKERYDEFIGTGIDTERSQVHFRVCEKVHNISGFGCLSMLVPSTISGERI